MCWKHKVQEISRASGSVNRRTVLQELQSLDMKDPHPNFGKISLVALRYSGVTLHLRLRLLRFLHHNHRTSKDATAHHTHSTFPSAQVTGRVSGDFLSDP